MPDSKANEAARNLIKSVQETNKAIADTTITTQERNLAFAQSVLENGIEVLKSHAESTRTLMQELVEQARKKFRVIPTLALPRSLLYKARWTNWLRKWVCFSARR